MKVAWDVTLVSFVLLLLQQVCGIPCWQGCWLWEKTWKRKKLVSVPSHGQTTNRTLREKRSSRNNKYLLLMWECLSVSLQEVRKKCVSLYRLFGKLDNEADKGKRKSQPLFFVVVGWKLIYRNWWEWLGKYHKKKMLRLVYQGEKAGCLGALGFLLEEMMKRE